MDHVVCPQCDTPYHPDLDEQRFCQGCKKWYHVKCLDPLLFECGGSLECVEMRTKYSEGRHHNWPYGKTFCDLLRKPISRGKNFGITGDGGLPDRALQVFTEIQEEERDLIMEDWERMGMTTEMLEMLEIEVDPLYYNCPTCCEQGEQTVL